MTLHVLVEMLKIVSSYLERERDIGVCGVAVLLCFLCNVSVNKIPHHSIAVISNSMVCDIYVFKPTSLLCMVLCFLLYDVAVFRLPLPPLPPLSLTAPLKMGLIYSFIKKSLHLNLLFWKSYNEKPVILFVWTSVYTIQTGRGGGAFDTTPDWNPLLLSNDCVYSVPTLWLFLKFTWKQFGVVRFW